jgi:hypothetical protein
MLIESLTVLFVQGSLIMNSVLTKLLLAVSVAAFAGALVAQEHKSSRQAEADIDKAEAYWTELFKVTDECISEIQLFDKTGKKCARAHQLLEQRDDITKLTPESTREISYIVGKWRAEKFASVREKANHNVSRMNEYIDWLEQQQGK